MACSLIKLVNNDNSMIPDNTLLNIFSCKRVSIITDSQLLVDSLHELNINAYNIEDGFPKASALISLPTTPEGSETINKQRTSQKPYRELSSAMHVFDPSVSTCIYTLKNILKSNYSESFSLQEKALRLINDNRLIQIEQQDSTYGVVEIHKNAIPEGLIEEDIIDSSFSFSIASLFEVSLSHIHSREPSPMTVNGQFSIKGLLGARRGYMDKNHLEAENTFNLLLREVAEHGAHLIVENNKVASFSIQGKEYINTLVWLAGEARGPNITEFAIGTNSVISDHIDFTINSQINEGVKGIHLGIGDGVSGYHIDLLCPNARATPKVNEKYSK